MNKPWWRVTQLMFGPLIVAILFTAGREIVVEVSGDSTVVTNGIRVYSEPFSYTNVIVNGERMLTNSTSFSAHDLIFKAKSNGEITNLVNELVSSGEFCRVRGHVWHYGKKDDNYYGLTFDTEFKTGRRCAVCRKIETRVDKPWK